MCAETFERFVHAKYIGTKRFSLEGSETLIPLLDLALEHAGRLGVEEAVLGMAHRGRLNVLIETMGKRPREMFAEVDDIDPESISTVWQPLMTTSGCRSDQWSGGHDVWQKSLVTECGL